MAALLKTALKEGWGGGGGRLGTEGLLKVNISHGEKARAV